MLSELVSERKKITKSKFFFLGLRVGILIFHDFLPQQPGERGQKLMFPASNQRDNFVSICKGERCSFNPLLSIMATHALIQFLAKDTEEILALSKRYLELGEICGEIEHIMQNCRLRT